MVNITFELWVKEHFVIEQITIRAKGSKSQKWEYKRGALKMHLCVGWCVKWNSLWCYTTLPSYNFTEWMISMIVTVRLWQWCPTFLSIGQILEKKSLGGQIFNLKLTNMSIISLFKHLKGAFSIQTTLWKGPAGILKYLGGQNNARGH